MGIHRLCRAKFAAGIALISFGGEVPVWAQQNPVLKEDALWIGYELPSNPDLAALAREVEAKARTERTGTVAICAQTPNSNACEREAEITFRGRLLADRNITFVVYADYAEENGSIHHHWLLNLKKRESVVDPDFDQNFYHLAPGRIHALGLHVKSGGCTLVRDNDERPVNYHDTSMICTMLFLKKNPTTMLQDFVSRGLAVDTELFDYGADVNARDNDGRTALMMSIDGPKWDWAYMAQLLLDHGADVNARDNDGSTALIGAALKGKRNTAKVLLEHGAEVNVADKSGRTALEVAVEQGLTKIASLLRRHGAK